MGCGSSSAAANDSPKKNAPEKVNDVKSEKKKEPTQEGSTSVDAQPTESVPESSTKDDSSSESKHSEESKDAKDPMKEELELIPKPDAHAKFDQQMGGHEGTFQKMDAAKIMKNAGDAETAFYEEIHNYPALQSFAPTFFGVKELDGKKYIVIEDLTHTFKKPCILDVKIGRQSFGEDASPEKKASMEAKDKKSTTHPLGMRITAMKVYQVESGDYVKTGKAEGKDVTVDNFQSALSAYFHNGKELRKELIPAFIEKIQKIREWMETQGELRIYSSSVLFVYDGEEGSDNQNVAVKIIDFAHVFKISDDGKDDGYIFGINNLLNTLEAIHSS